MRIFLSFIILCFFNTLAQAQDLRPTFLRAIPDHMRASFYPDSGLQPARNNYMRTCVSAGVPLPPDFTCSNDLWQRRDDKVFSYFGNAPRGRCDLVVKNYNYILVGNSKRAFREVEIECEGNDTGNICTWTRRFDRVTPNLVWDEVFLLATQNQDSRACPVEHNLSNQTSTTGFVTPQSSQTPVTIEIRGNTFRRGSLPDNRWVE